MEIFLTIIQVVVIAYLFSGLIVSIYALLASRNLQEQPLFGIKFFGSYLFYSGAFFALCLMLSQGLQELLFFIPDSWGGYDEYGEWTSARENWSTFGALFLTGLIFWYVGNSEEAKKNKGEKSITN